MLRREEEGPVSREQDGPKTHSLGKPLNAFVRNNKTLFSMRAYGSAANLLPEHIGLPTKIINLH